MAAVDYFLNIGGIPGESQDGKHEGEIEVLSWSWGETATTSGVGGGGGGGKVNIEDIHFTSNFSKASPQLLLACASGKHFKSAVLTARRSGAAQFEFLTVSLNDVLVSSYRTKDEEEDEYGPVDSFSLNFSQIRFDYREMEPDGSAGETVKTGWDVKQNKQI